MGTPKVILFCDVCRLCLVKQAVDNLFENADLVNDIYLCTGVKVRNHANLPSKICSDCLDIVSNAKKLRELAMANDLHLKSMFDGIITDVSAADVFNKHEAKTQFTNITSNANKILYPNICSSSNEESYSNISSNSKEESSTQLNNDSNVKGVKIRLRKDLFSSEWSVTSSTKDVSGAEDKLVERNRERIKRAVNDGACLKCGICNKKFETPRKYYAHRRTHYRKYVCDHDSCGKRFATNGDLEKHTRTHTGERPFACVICLKTFNQRATLKAHRETVHGDINKNVHQNIDCKP